MKFMKIGVSKIIVIPEYICKVCPFTGACIDTVFDPGTRSILQ